MSKLIENLNLIESYKLDIKSAIEAKGVDMTGVALSGYADAIGEIQAGGGDFDQRSITERNFQIVNLYNNASFVSSAAFDRDTYIQTVNLPECTSIGNSAFYNCSSLSQVSLPVCSYIGNNAPVCSYIGNNAFTNCYSLSQVSLPETKFVGSSAFQSCYSLSQVSLPVCSYIGDNAFTYCSSLSQVSLPVCEYIGGNAFTYCSSLSQVSLPVCSYIGNNAFYNCSNLEEVTLDLYGYIIPRYSGILGGTKIASGVGSIYVPYGLYEKYISSSGWSSLSERFVSYGDPSYIALSFSDGLVYGSTPYLDYSFNSYIGISYNQVTSISLTNCINILSRPGWSPPQYVFSTQMSSTLENVYIGKLSRVVDNLFFRCYKLKIVDLPSCEYVDVAAFQSCYSLSQVSLPVCEYIGSYAFQSCYSLSQVSLPVCSYIGSYAFTYCSSLSQVSLPVCSYIGIGAFTNCSSLSQVSLPVCEYIGGNAFQNCISLSYVSLPVCSYIGSYAFTNCSSLSQVSLPVCSYIGSYAFRSCIKLRFIDLGECTSIMEYAFYYCTNLSTVIIRSSEVCSIKNTTFSYTSLSEGYVYVPESLVSAYQVAEYWSSYNILPILEDLEFRNGLVYGWAGYLDSGYLNELGITAADVTSVSMSFLTSISSSTFMNHYNMVSYDIPLLTEYPDDAFNGCSALSELYISIPVGNRAFANCTGLTVVNVDYNGIIPAGSDMFSNCNSLSLINVPYDYYESYISADGWSVYSSLMVKAMPSLSFYNGLVFGSTSILESNYLAYLGITSNQVVSVSLPSCSYLGYYVFNEHHSLKDLSLPEVTYIESNAFFGANYINDLVLPKCSYIGFNCFSWTGLGNFRNLTLGYSSVVSVGGNIGLSGNISHIYVPSSLVEDYKVAYYWSTMSNKIYPISE